MNNLAYYATAFNKLYWTFQWTCIA